MKNTNFILPVIIFLLAVLACGGESKTEEIKSSRLKYVENLHYGSVGSHGSHGWYVSGRYLYVNDKSYTPAELKMDDLLGCKASPNQAVEVLKCESAFLPPEGKQTGYILRMKGDQPEWVKTPDTTDIWVGEGHWLLFKDLYFNVETSEQKIINGLPAYPKEYFMATSPDLKTIIYQEDYFGSRYDLPLDTSAEAREIEEKKQDELRAKHKANGIAAFWLIDVETGQHRLLELPRDKYEWAVHNTQKFYYKSDWLNDFQSHLVWEKDKKGKDQLVSPK